MFLTVLLSFSLMLPIDSYAISGATFAPILIEAICLRKQALHADGASQV
jgi:hypothetical protein